MQPINYVAWWGAILASIVFAWDILKWLKTGPRIVARIKRSTVYPDSPTVRIELTPQGEVGELQSFTHVELVNVGTIAATVANIEATHIEHPKKGQLFMASTVFTGHYGKTLPIVLAPGEVWSCRVACDNIERLEKRGRPIIRVQVSYKEKPLIFKVPLLPARARSQKSKA